MACPTSSTSPRAASPSAPRSPRPSRRSTRPTREWRSRRPGTRSSTRRSCAAILVVIFVLDISRAPSMLLALPVLGLAGVTFASLALVFNALAKGYDFFTYYFTLVITPMTFLSGVYFPMDQMPAWLQAAGQALPLRAAVELVRPLILGEMPHVIVKPLLVLLAYAVAGYYLALVLTRR